MPIPQPLDTLLELARHRTDEAIQRLGELQAEQVSAEQRLALLLDYRREYLDQLNARQQQGLSLAQWRNYQDFVETLDGAIAQQRAIAEQASDRLADGRGQWQQCRQKQNAYDTLAHRRAQEQRRADDRRDQQGSDERAARQFLQRPAHLA